MSQFDNERINLSQKKDLFCHASVTIQSTNHLSNEKENKTKLKDQRDQSSCIEVSVKLLGTNIFIHTER
jgi:hypothetical protein